MNLTNDALVMLLLCSQVGLEPGAGGAAEVESIAVKPLTLREWNPLARKLQAESLRPADLLSLPTTEWQTRLSLAAEEIERLGELLARVDGLSRRLERYAQLGIHPLTRANADYPTRYRERLKDSAPLVLFYAGEKTLLGQPGIAVVGSRNLDQAGQECAQFVGNACGMAGLVLYSGGAKGVDTLSMEAALAARGCAVAVLPENLERSVRIYKEALRRGDLCLLTPYSPNAGFSVGAAMGRNRLIYTLADYAIVVASDVETGGTWAGASEALKHGWLPVFVLEHDQMPEGNRLLLQKGALPFPHPFKDKPTKLSDWLQEQSAKFPSKPAQPSLF